MFSWFIVFLPWSQFNKLVKCFFLIEAFNQNTNGRIRIHIGWHYVMWYCWANDAAPFWWEEEEEEEVERRARNKLIKLHAILSILALILLKRASPIVNHSSISRCLLQRSFHCSFPLLFQYFPHKIDVDRGLYEWCTINGWNGWSICILISIFPILCSWVSRVSAWCSPSSSCSSWRLLSPDCYANAFHFFFFSYNDFLLINSTFSPSSSSSSSSSCFRLLDDLQSS